MVNASCLPATEVFIKRLLPLVTAGSGQKSALPAIIVKTA
jgi:hypothetical protein